MITALATVITLGFIVAATPSAVVANLAFLLSQRGTRKSVAFLIGWTVALVIMCAFSFALTYVAVSTGGKVLHVKRPELLAWLEILVGAAMIFAAALSWRRGKTQIEKLMGKALAGVDALGTGSGFLLGAGGAFLNLPWALAAAAAVASIQSAGAIVVLIYFLIFMAVASISVAVPTLYTVVFPDRSHEFIEATRVWLVENGNRVTAAATAVIAALVMLKGLNTLLG